MKKTDYLITLGEIWVKKYASVNAETLKPEITKHIWESIKNTAGNNGIMNFPSMINADKAFISFFVVRNDSLGYKNIKVLDFTISPSSLTSKYESLPQQIEKYLNKNWELFPSMNNDQPVDYNQFAIYLAYNPQQSDLIAGD